MKRNVRILENKGNKLGSSQKTKSEKKNITADFSPNGCLGNLTRSGSLCTEKCWRTHRI